MHKQNVYIYYIFFFFTILYKMNVVMIIGIFIVLSISIVLIVLMSGGVAVISTQKNETPSELKQEEDIPSNFDVISKVDVKETKKDDVYTTFVSTTQTPTTNVYTTFVPTTLVQNTQAQTTQAQNTQAQTTQAQTTQAQTIQAQTTQAQTTQAQTTQAQTTQAPTITQAPTTPSPPKIDGVLGEWETNGICLCDAQTKQYTRTYTAPLNGGKDAIDYDKLTKSESCRCSPIGQKIVFSITEENNCIMLYGLEVYSNSQPNINLARDKSVVFAGSPGYTFPDGIQSVPSNVIRMDGLYHSTCKKDDFVSIDLGREFSIDRIIIRGVDNRRSANKVVILGKDDSIKWVGELKDIKKEYTWEPIDCNKLTKGPYPSECLQQWFREAGCSNDGYFELSSGVGWWHSQSPETVKNDMKDWKMNNKGQCTNV